MLRDHGRGFGRGVRRQDRLEEADDEAQPKGENDPGDHDPPVAQPQERRRLPQLL